MESIFSLFHLQELGHRNLFILHLLPASCCIYAFEMNKLLFHLSSEFLYSCDKNEYPLCTVPVIENDTEMRINYNLDFCESMYLTRSLSYVNNHSKIPGVVSGRVVTCVDPEANCLGSNPISASSGPGRVL